MAGNRPGPAALNTQERLEVLRERLAEARGDNLRAVDEENRRPTEVTQKRKSESAGESTKQPGRVSSHSAEERDVEDEAMTSRLRQRVVRMERAAAEASTALGIDVDTNVVDIKGTESAIVVYGGKGALKRGAAELVAAEITDAERRRVKGRVRDKFDEEQDEIGFINDHNRKFNARLNKHYDKYESVHSIKDNLERGTALPGDK
jgi:hypothetical protein